MMNRDLIYDVGMHDGSDTAYYLHCGYRVLAIEADPGLINAARLRFRSAIADGRLQLLNVGVAAAEGVSDFWVCDSNTVWSSFDRRMASRGGAPHHRIEVRCRSFASIVDEFGVPYYLKVDIEGNDLLCIEDLDANALPRYLSTEASGDLRVLERLHALGFSGFKGISQFHYLPLELPLTDETKRYARWHWLLTDPGRASLGLRMALGGRRLLRRLMRRRMLDGWEFPFGASGPFGENTPGRWQDYDEMRATYCHFLERYNNGEASPFWSRQPQSFWMDFHAVNEEAQACADSRGPG